MSSKVESKNLKPSGEEAELHRIVRGHILDKDRYLPDIVTWKNVAYAVERVKCGDDDAFDKRLMTQFEAAGHDQGCCVSSDPLKKLDCKCKRLSMVLALATKFTKSNITHPRGVGARGHATVLENDLIPESEFFKPGTVFDVSARHGRFGPKPNDDGALGGYSLSVKFSGADGQTVWDLMSNTGRLSSFFHYRSFVTSLPGMGKTLADVQTRFWKYPVMRMAFTDSLRLGPDSLTKLYYHAWPVHEFVCKDRKERWVRFRILPGDHVPEDPDVAGYLSVRRQIELLSNFEREPDEARSVTYLTDDFLRRLVSDTVKYTVQIQVRTEVDDEAFNVSRPWDENEHPWLDFIDLELNTPISDTDLKRMAFYAGNLPPCLKVPQPVDEWDYKCIQYMRTKIYPRIQRARGGQT